MFQSRALIVCVLLFVIKSSSVKSDVSDELNAVIVPASTDEQPDEYNYDVGIFQEYPPHPLQEIKPNLNCKTSDNRAGTCMTINECHPTWKVFRTEPKDSWIFGLYNACSKYGENGKEVNGVCCPNNNNDQVVFPSRNQELPKRRIKRATACLLTDNQKWRIKNTQCIKSHVMKRSIVNERAFIANHIKLPNAEVYPQNPVQKFVSRSRRAIDLSLSTSIIGGRPVNPHQFKFMAALFTEDYLGRMRQFCGGTIIDEYHILTAAHCVASYTENDVRRLRVHLGVHNKKNTRGQSIHKVDRIIRHIDFSQRTLDNDVAILTLSTPAPIRSNANIKPVCMLTGSNTLENQNAIVSGWGSLQFGTSRLAKELHSVNVKVWNNNECNSNYGSQAPGGITPRMMCASLPGKDSCQGDSGGALFTCSGPSDCTQIGIVSWGIGCGLAQYPGVYTRVTKMIDWIERITSCY